MPICGNNIRVSKMSKSYFEIREALEVGTNKIVDEYKKATPGQVAEAPEDDMPASPDEAGMAMDQAKFIGYVANEIKEYIGGNKEFPEWMQNKLTGLHEKAKDMHAVMAGKYNESVDEGMKPDRVAPGWMLRQDPKLKAKVDANRAKNKEFEKNVGTKVDRVPKGEYDRKVDSYLKKKYNKEEVELVDEATTIHLPKKYMQGGSEMEDQVSAAIHKAAGSPKMHSIDFKFGVRFEVERDGKIDQKLTDILRKNLKEDLDEAIDMSKAGKYARAMDPKTKEIKKVLKTDLKKYVDKGWTHMAPLKNRLTKEEVELVDEANRGSDSYRVKYKGDINTVRADSPEDALKKSMKTFGISSVNKKDYMDKASAISEASDLDELSQATLRSYHGKASAQAQKAKEVVKKNMAAKSPTAGSTAKAGKAYSTFSKRVKGLNRSADKMEATVTEVNDRAQERNAQINKVLGPTKNAAQGIEALKKAFKVNDAEAKKMLAQAMSESSAAYGKSEKERREKEAKSKLTPKDKVTLDKLRAMMAKEKK